MRGFASGFGAHAEDILPGHEDSVGRADGMGDEDDGPVDIGQVFLFVSHQVLDDPVNHQIQVILLAFQVFIVDVVEQFGELFQGDGEGPFGVQQVLLYVFDGLVDQNVVLKKQGVSVQNDGVLVRNRTGPFFDLLHLSLGLFNGAAQPPDLFRNLLAGDIALNNADPGTVEEVGLAKGDAVGNLDSRKFSHACCPEGGSDIR